MKDNFTSFIIMVNKILYFAANTAYFVSIKCLNKNKEWGYNQFSNHRTSMLWEIKNNKQKTCLNVRLGKIINLNCYPDFNVIPGI